MLATRDVLYVVYVLDKYGYVRKFVHPEYDYAVDWANFWYPDTDAVIRREVQNEVEVYA